MISTSFHVCRTLSLCLRSSDARISQSVNRRCSAWTRRAPAPQPRSPLPFHRSPAHHGLGPNPPGDLNRASVGDLLSISSLDEMLHCAHTVLKSAERRVGDYCSTFVRPRSEGGTAEGANGGQRRSCWHVYRSLHQARKRLEAEAGAEVVTTGRAGRACADLEALQALVRELESVPSEDVCRVLAANDRLLGSLAGRRRRRRDRWVDQPACLGGSPGGGSRSGSDYEGSKLSGAESGEEGGAVPEEAEEGQEEEEEAGEEEEMVVAGKQRRSGSGGGAVAGLSVVEGLERARAEAVFAALDRTGRRWLDRDDLLAGLAMLGEHLDPSDVEQICLEMSGTGRIDLQAFCDIVEAERLVVPGSDAIFLRHLRHDRPEWWTEPPSFLGSM